MAAPAPFIVTDVPVDGWPRTKKRNLIPTEAECEVYRDFLLTLQPAARKDHVGKMLWQHPRLAAEAIHGLYNFRMAHLAKKRRRDERELGRNMEISLLVKWDIANLAPIAMDAHGVAWPTTGALPVAIPPIPPLL